MMRTDDVYFQNPKTNPNSNPSLKPNPKKPIR